MADGDRYNVWRESSVKPFQRWAMEVEEDSKLPDRYRIVTSDPAVADGAFVAQFAADAAQPIEAMVGGEEDGQSWDGLETIGIENPEHLQTRLWANEQGQVWFTGPAPEDVR